MKRRSIVALLMLGLMLCLGGCSSAPPQAAETVKPCTEVVAAILEGQAFEEMTELGEKQIAKYLEIDTELLSDMAMSIDASRATAEAVAVLTAKDEASLAEAQAALEAYRAVTLEQYRDYRPEEVPKLEDAILSTKGLQTALIISKDAAAAETALQDAW